MSTKGSVLFKLLNGEPVAYDLISSTATSLAKGAGSLAKTGGSIIRTAGPMKFLVAGVAVTLASIASFDRSFEEQRKKLIQDPNVPPTALNKMENKYLAKLDRNPLVSMGLGFYSTFTKPWVVAGKVIATYSGKPVQNSELLSAMLSQGVVPMIKDGYRVLATGEMYTTVAERVATQAVEAAKERLWNLPWQVVTFKVPITEVWTRYQQLRDVTEEAARQASTMQSDGSQLFGALMRYYTTSKLFEYAGGIGAGLVTAFAYNKYLASPAERLFGPTARTVTRIATLPVRPVISAQAAKTLGTLLARRSPLAILLLLQGLGTFYSTQNEFKIFVNDVAESYPEVATQVVKQIKSDQNSRV